ncbi:hypothetical protein E4T56_gene19669 [Termitomyces sp. T112]|nr:hypothetical protein E4T56_gene19669 [Termitomyces sp. T112]
MSSPSIPVVSPAPLPSDLDEVVVYDSGGEDFERWHHASVRDWSQSSVVVVVDSPGVPKRTKFRPVLPKEGSMGQSVGKAGFLRGDQGKGASSAVTCGKCRASPSSGAGPSKRPQGCELSAGPPESPLFSPTPGVPLERSSSPPVPIPSITEVFLHKQVEALTTSLAAQEGELQWAREDHDAARTEKEVMERERNTLMEGQPAGKRRGGDEFRGGMCCERSWRRRGRGRIGWPMRPLWSMRGSFMSGLPLLCSLLMVHFLGLDWVREHQVLLDGASMAFASIQDRLMQGSAVQPPELQQGMAQLERLLAGHWRRNAVAPESWWEVAVDVGEALPGLAEVLAVVRAQMEVDLGIGLLGHLGRE